MPCGAAAIGRYVDKLQAFLRDRPAEDALADTGHWLCAG
jgi:hypothetical protein